MKRFHERRCVRVDGLRAVQPDGHNKIAVEPGDRVKGSGVILCTGQHIVPHDGRFSERFDFLREAVDVIDGDAGAGKAALTAFRALAETPHFIASEMQIAALRMHFGGLFNERGGQLKRALAQRAQFTGCVRNFPQVFVLREFQRVFQMPKTLLERDHVNEVIVRGLKQLIELFPRQCIERVAELPALARQLVLVLDHKRVQFEMSHLADVLQNAAERRKEPAHIEIIAAHGEIGPVRDLERRMGGKLKILAQSLETVEQPGGVRAAQLQRVAA